MIYPVRKMGILQNYRSALNCRMKKSLNHQLKSVVFSNGVKILAFFLLIFFAYIVHAQTLDPATKADISELYGLIGRFYYKLIIPVATVLAGIVIFYAGITYAGSNGSEEAAKAAKTYITGAVSGLILVLLAAFLLQVLGAGIS
ncbi:hypothetical protein COT77_01550 [Candidatus Berkelbacteria bacterium CG10_big_fil_rev_8_21_14_0_10_41_12]|uniref:Uncharacterized protein n=1 Tax=Candidatus Berkelbacteria bacterium CG10_big_fil_rev_8_21_14_0_10_41_12 TaxID=1974513 RepID=A0A2M6WXA2_9BACT|nr:MAG: hypothetical protein COT77_01550 [Candidatus Berkelbacteria bacterium CG10_big_fil_rev_8_21_14_0_10_41_12]